jgi:hypothetical protein
MTDHLTAATVADTPLRSNIPSSSTDRIGSGSGSSSGSGSGIIHSQRMHTPFNSEASLQIAARQKLFDYAVEEALDILDIIAKQIQIPEYKTTIDIPIIGGIDVEVSSVNITNLQLPRDLAKVAIESGYYHLKAANLTAQVGRQLSGREAAVR